MDPSKLLENVERYQSIPTNIQNNIIQLRVQNDIQLQGTTASVPNAQILGSEDQTTFMIMKLIQCLLDQTKKQEQLINKMNEQIQTLMEKQDKLDKGFAVLLSAISNINTLDSAKSKTGITAVSGIKNKNDSADEVPDLDENGTAQVSSPGIKSRLRSSK